MTSVLIVIPTYNESLILEKNVRQIFNFASKNLNAYDWRVLIADNGSSDKTPEIAHRLTKELPSLSCFHLKESSRGLALKKAWREGEADILIYMDADLSTDLSALPALIAAILNGADVAIGSRLIPGARVKRSFFREIISRGYNFLIFLFLRLPVKDAQCGFKAIKKEAAIALLPLIKNNQWFFDTELLFAASRRGFKITEIPISWIETRDRGRKSTVKIFKTIKEYLREIYRLRRENLKLRRSRAAPSGQ